MVATKLSELFITGCDKNTRWMLPWFKENFYKYNPDANLHVFDFDEMGGGWFCKPTAMVDATKMADNICWLDTDCEIRDDITGIFYLVESNKLTMIEDQPWTMRRGEKWHNSGVVAFKGKPVILTHWQQESSMILEDRGPMYGDQDVLHELVRSGLNRQIHINTIPKRWNTLRLDLLDGNAPSNIKIMHWTGKMGKDEIRKQMNE
jgi:hypothetical protein